MIEVRRTAEFDEWLQSLRDVQGRARILRRIDRVQAGNLGDIARVGGGMCGGDKASHRRDIERAQALAREYG